LTRRERRALDALARQLDDGDSSVGHRLRRPGWWECPSFARAMTSMTFFGAVPVLDELGGRDNTREQTAVTAV